MFETETVGPFLVWKLKWGGGGAWPPAPSPPVATPLVMESFSSPKRGVWVMRESFFSKIRLSISLIRKVSAVKKIVFY